MFFLPKKILQNEENFSWLGRHYTIPKGFVYQPSIPKFVLDYKGISYERAYNLALIHDYLYVKKITSWIEADNWLFEKTKLNFLERTLFRLFSWVWWIT